jgi:hypothetical protein
LAIALFLAAAVATDAPAQTKQALTIESVHVGLPAGFTDPDTGHTRRGAWAPVYVKLKVGSEAIIAGSLNLVAEADDSEGTPYRYKTPLPGAAPEDDVFAVTYIRPGSAEVNVSLRPKDDETREIPFQIRGLDGRNVTVSRVPREFSRSNLSPGDALYLVLGSRLPGLGGALKEDANAGEQNQLDERGPRKVSYLDNARDLPDHWYGYDAVDVVILTTASDSFVRQLLEQKAARRALGEWVRRGGKLIVSAGRNRQLVADLLEQLPLSEFDKQPLINCRLDGAVTAKGKPALALPIFTRWLPPGREAPPLEVAELTRLRPNAVNDPESRAEPVSTFVREAPTEEDKEGLPVIVHAASGLGRVVLIAFDLDTPPFSTWPGQKPFWEKMLETELEARPVNEDRFRGARANMDGESSAIGAELKGRLESFKEVPVISFGWVALFILVYIIIVGPLDYLILKKVFKRLELTWITFPTVVLVISVAAYFTAYSLKGDDLRINKIDVLDLDLHGPAPQAYGTTWVTLFSPRIQNYTVGIEPAAPSWVEAPSASAATPGPVVTVMEGNEFLNPRMGSQGLFGRRYLYAADASGLEQVSIPVWAMRTFTARWRAPVSAEKPPIVAELRHARGQAGEGLLGRVTNNLPVELRDVTLVYKGKTFSAGGVAPGAVLPIDNLKIGEGGKGVGDWLRDGSALSAGSSRTVTGPDLIRDLMFHGEHAKASKSNGGWRPLDQAWRLHPLNEMSWLPQPVQVYRDEVLLVARVASQADTSESVSRADASPTRLWLDALPGPQSQRPPLNGYIVQDVYLRAYIPVQ